MHPALTSGDLHFRRARLRKKLASFEVSALRSSPRRLLCWKFDEGFEARRAWAIKLCCVIRPSERDAISMLPYSPPNAHRARTPDDHDESLSLLELDLIDLRVLDRMEPVPDDSSFAAQTSSADRSAARILDGRASRGAADRRP